MSIPRLSQDLRAAQTALADSLAGATDRELHTPPAEGEWTAAEVAAHVIEMQPMWMAKAANGRAEPDLARSHSEIERRTEQVEARAGDDLGEVEARLAQSNAAAAASLEGMADADLDVVVTYGASRATGAASEAIRALCIAHLREHAEQIAQTRRAAG